METTLKDQLKRFQDRINLNSSPQPDSAKIVWLDEQAYLCEPDCPVCHGIGYIRYDVPVGDPSFGRMFPCPHSDPFKRYAGLMGLSTEDQKLSWDSVINKDNVMTGVKAVKKILGQGYGWVFLWGDYGLAKTLILKIALVEYARETRKPCSYVRMAEIIDHLRGAFDAKNPSEESSARLETWSSLPFLAIDEFDRVRETEYATERRFVLMDRRYESACRQKSITIMASNASPSTLEGYLSDRIFDGRFEVVQLQGKSTRPMMTY